MCSSDLQVQVVQTSANLSERLTPLPDLEFGGAAVGHLPVVRIDADTKEHTSATFTAKRVAERRPRPPERHEFVPTTFYRRFSPDTKPVLTIWPGDTVHTTTVDAGGTDEKGVTRVLAGNPETGPFYIETALPGDVLAVHIVRLKLNRDWAMSDDFVVPRAVDSDLAVKLKDTGKSVQWHLDRTQMIARQDKPTEHLKDYIVPLHPMLGCVGVAPGFASAARPGRATPAPTAATWISTELSRALPCISRSGNRARFCM